MDSDQNIAKKEEPATPRKNAAKKEELTPLTQASADLLEYAATLLPNKRAREPDGNPSDSASDDEDRMFVKTKKKKSDSELVPPSTRVLRARPVMPPPRRCYDEIPPSGVKQTASLTIIATNTQAVKIGPPRNASRSTNTQAVKIGPPRNASRSTNTQPVKVGPPRNASQAIRPETYFWPVATVMRRKVQKFIESQRDALTELDAELLVLHCKHKAELKNLPQERRMRQSLQNFIDGQRKSLTAMDAELVGLNREHEAEQRQLRREVLGLD